MAALFDDVFNKASIYEMFFFNLKSVLIHPTLSNLEKNNPQLFERWKYLSKSKYDCNVVSYETIKEQFPDNFNTVELEQETVYKENAPYFAEYSKIVAITYASLYTEDGALKRYFKKIVNNDEANIISQFFDVLNELSSDGVKSQPQFFPILCGHNIISYDIPFLIKRYIKNREIITSTKQIPFILKRSLNIKPWESGIIDTLNVWKFNGFDNMPLMLIADFLELKKKTDLLPLPELSKYYWDNFDKNQAETLEFVSLQSATQTNFVIQLMNELRQL